MIAYVSLKKNQVNKIMFNNFKIVKPTDNELIANVNINSNYSEKKKQKISKKFIKILKRNDVDAVIFEHEIIDEFSLLYEYALQYDFKIINGNYLYESMLYEILEYILNNSKNLNIEQVNLGLALNLLSYNRLEFIKDISTKVKGISILTNDVSKFSNIANQIMEDTGLCVKVSNNPKSGIKNCDIVINFDYDLNKNIDLNYNNCIVLNFNNKIDKIKKTYKGIIINDVNVNIEDNYILKYINPNKYRNIALAQSINESKDNLRINYLIGTKEKINTKEFENFRIIKNVKKKK